MTFYDLLLFYSVSILIAQCCGFNSFGKIIEKIIQIIRVNVNAQWWSICSIPISLNIFTVIWIKYCTYFTALEHFTLMSVQIIIIICHNIRDMSQSFQQCIYFNFRKQKVKLQFLSTYCYCTVYNFARIFNRTSKWIYRHHQHSSI